MSPLRLAMFTHTRLKMTQMNVETMSDELLMAIKAINLSVLSATSRGESSDTVEGNAPTNEENSITPVVSRKSTTNIVSITCQRSAKCHFRSVQKRLQQNVLLFFSIIFPPLLSLLRIHRICHKPYYESPQRQPIRWRPTPRQPLLPNVSFRSMLRKSAKEPISQQREG